MSLDASVAELETITADWLAADPQRLEQARQWLERRGGAVEAIVAGLAEGRGDPALVERARRAWERGRQIQEHLELVRAGARHELGALYRDGFVLRALTAQAPECSASVLDVEA